jgi:DNA-binding CsgD family transcriptional regulator
MTSKKRASGRSSPNSRAPARIRSPYSHLLSPAAFDASPDCIKIIGLDGRLKHLNRAGGIALGVDPHKAQGVDWIGLLPPQVHGLGFGSLRNAALGENVRFYGLSDGEAGGLRKWDNMLTPLRGASGVVENILCVSRDVTDRELPPHGIADPPHAMPMMREFDHVTGHGMAHTPDAGHEPLSFRERECLFWAGLGKTAWETSVIIGRSRRTVEFHLANAVKKLGAANKYHAAIIALNKGML